MFIGIIGTRFSGKSTVVDYLKSRGFTSLHLRGGNEDDSASTVASSLDNDNVLDGSEEVLDLSSVDPNAYSSANASGSNSKAGPSGSHPIPIPIPASAPIPTTDSLSIPGYGLDLSGEGPNILYNLIYYPI
jgi:hypothetical protein